MKKAYRLSLDTYKALAENPKAFFDKSEFLRARIEAKRDQIQEWRWLTENITNTPDEIGGTGPAGFVESTLENVVLEIAEAEQEMLQTISKLLAQEREIDAAIQLLVKDPRHRVILEHRYVNCYPWEEIERKLRYARRWVMRLHSAALKEIKLAAQRSGLVVHNAKVGEAPDEENPSHRG